ncbi:DnaJ domain-containing protein [Tricladium varicosporioides]|nr:DnaJ domain-containing protein [Hymenoscyphus varicosporioides]
MAPVPITEDYYMILEVERTATLEVIIRSYKRLALKLHPDRNAKHDATESFQLLGRAYETLKDVGKRRAYDLIYPSISRNRPSPQATQTHRPPPTSTPQTGALNEAAQIAALEKSKQERSVRWRTKKNTLDSSIFELERDIRRLKQDISNLDNIAATEAAKEAQKNSWGAWLLSPIYKKAEDSEEEKARKDRERQERRIEKDMKERRLGLKQADLKKERNSLRMAKEEVDAADLVDNKKIRVIQERIRTTENWERQERERIQREREAKIQKEQQEQWVKWEREQREKREREAAEALRKQEEELKVAEALRKQKAKERAAEQKRQEERAKEWQKIFNDETKTFREQYTHLNPPEHSYGPESVTRHTFRSTCRHDGWWPKVQGRTACPKCYEVWTYLLQCPGCEVKACPRCQAAIRPKIPHSAARRNRRGPPRVRTPSPDIFYDDY